MHPSNTGFSRESYHVWQLRCHSCKLRAPAEAEAGKNVGSFGTTILPGEF
jgi:hypothetical protein